jgi:p-aminobenzoyl-glutamate transporter AbgT
MEIMLKNKNGFQVNISLSIFFIAFCDLFTDFPSYYCLLAIYLGVTVCEHCVILQQIVKYTYINKRVSLIWG